MRDDAGDEDLAVRELDVLPQVILVLVPGVGRLDQVGAGVDLEHDVGDVRERHVVGVRAVPAAPAQVVPDAVGGQAVQGVVEHLDAVSRVAAVGVQVELGVAVPGRRDPCVVDLKDEPGVDDRPVLLR